MTTPENIRPERAFSSHGITAAFITTHTKACTVLWAGSAAVLFFRNYPVALREGGRLHVRVGLPIAAVRHISRWLRANNYPTMSSANTTHQFHELLLAALSAEVSSMHAQAREHKHAL